MPLRILALAILAVAVTTACSAPPPQKTELPPLTPIMVPPSMTGGDNAAALGGRVWAWQRTRFSDGRVVMPDAPERYTVQFLPDDRAQLRVDCNRGNARYTVGAGQALSFSPAALTKMGCPRGSQDTEFMRQLVDVAGYAFADGTLVLTLRAGAGAMTFAPLSH